MTDTNQRFRTIKSFKTPSNVTTTPLSQEELNNLKDNKPFEYLKLMMTARGRSINNCSNSSTTSGGHSHVETTDKLLQNIKEKYFDVDMIEALENDTSACYGIKNLLKQVDILRSPPEFAEVIIELGILIDQVTIDFNHKWETTNKIQNKQETQEAEWDAVAESTKKVEDMETSFHQGQEEFNTCTANISAWEK